MTAETAVALRGAAAVPAETVNALAARLLNNKGLFADDMSPLQAKQLAMVGEALGLDPFLGDLTLYEGKPLVTLQGWIRQALASDAFDGIEGSWPATFEERAAFRVGDDEDMFTAKVWRKGVRFPATGYGRAGGPYERNALVVGSKRTGYNPQRGPELARKRAIVNAIKQLFPLPVLRLPDVPVYAVEDDDPAGGVIDVAAQPTPEGPAGITPGQTRAIHASARALGLDDAAYRDRLEQMFNVRSSQELNAAQAEAAIAAFATEASESAQDAQSATPETVETLDAAIKDVRAKARAEGRRVGDALVLNDEPEGRADAARPPTQEELNWYAQALSQGAKRGLDLARYEIDPTAITVEQLQALYDNLTAELEA